MLIVEDVLMVGTSAEGKDLIGQFRRVVVGGAVLTELLLRGHLALDAKGKIRVLEAPAPEERVLAEGLQQLARAEGRRARFVLPQLGDHLSEVALEGLRRGEVLQPEAVRLLGLKVGTDWPAVAPALRDHRCRQLVAVLLGVEPPTTSALAPVALLHAANVLPAVLPQALRPATSDKALKERARALVTGGWEPRSEAELVLAGALVTRQAWQGAGRNAGRF